MSAVCVAPSQQSAAVAGAHGGKALSTRAAVPKHSVEQAPHSA